MTCGRVYLVGAGPGDPGLITVRGKEILSRVDVVVYDALVCPRLLDYARADAERVYVGKRGGHQTLSQSDIQKLVVERAKAGACVVRLKGGDPFVFGRGGEEALALAEAGIPFEVVPGVTAAIAAAAYAGIPVTHRGLASTLGFVTGHEASDKDAPGLDWAALAKWEGTLAFYMGAGNLNSICRELVVHGLSADTPAAAIMWGTTPRQRTVTATLCTLTKAASEAGIESPAIILVGNVVSLRSSASWFERRLLFGRTIVVTRARSQSSELVERLEELGADVIECPVIRIEPPLDAGPLRVAAASLNAFDWIVLTSVNGVEALFAALKDAGKDSRSLAGCKVAAVGPATSERLADFGIRPDVVPSSVTGAALAAEVTKLADLSEKRILCPRSDIAPKDLIEALSAAGAKVHDIIAYRTVPDETAFGQVTELLAQDKVDWITFTSSSGVTNFFSGVDVGTVRGNAVRIASIGPATSATLRELRIAVSVEAAKHTIEGLVDAILEHEKRGAAK